MKTRIGFVSNSSTTSFIIYGCEIYNENESKTAQKIFTYLKELPGFSELCEKHKLLKEIMDSGKCNDILSLTHPLEKLCGGITIEMGQDNTNIYIGRSPCEMKDGETMGEFKQNISKVVKGIFGDDTECDFCEESWYNG